MAKNSDKRKDREDPSCLSQYEVAERLGISRTRVRQIEEQALAKLRKWMKGSDWAPVATPHKGADRRDDNEGKGNGR